MASLARFAPQFERPDFSETSGDLDWNFGDPGFFAKPQDCRDGREVRQRVRDQPEHLPRLVTAARARSVERETHRLIGQDLELLFRQVNLFTLLHASAYETDGGDRIVSRFGLLLPIPRASSNAQVVRTGTPPTDSDSVAAPHQAVIGCSVGDS